jgi:hypothetical protein
MGLTTVTICCLSVVIVAEDEDPSGKRRSEKLTAQRLEVIRERVSDATVQSSELEFPTRFADKPIFKYSDPARGRVSSAVWKLGDEGRPKAILVSELIPKNLGSPCIAYEFISLTKTPFSVSSSDMNWSPASTLYEFKPVPKAPAPEKTPVRRLIQMREIASRFECREVDENQKCELRMLSQPVDRYVPSKAPNADGAIFLFTFGTNPEVLLLMESDGTQWQYAAGRMTGAEEVVLTIDGTIEWKAAALQPGTNSPYTGSIAPIEIPGIAKDGSELTPDPGNR